MIGTSKRTIAAMHYPSQSALYAWLKVVYYLQDVSQRLYEMLQYIQGVLGLNDLINVSHETSGTNFRRKKELRTTLHHSVKDAPTFSFLS